MLVLLLNGVFDPLDSGVCPWRANPLDVEPLGIDLGGAVAGRGPEEMGIGSVFAVPELLKRHGPTLDDIDIVESNGAFSTLFEVA